MLEASTKLLGMAIWLVYYWQISLMAIGMQRGVNSPESMAPEFPNRVCGVD